jgi:hypothetical protein
MPSSQNLCLILSHISVVEHIWSQFEVMIPVPKPQRKELTVSKLLGPCQIYHLNGHIPSRDNV